MALTPTERMYALYHERHDGSTLPGGLLRWYPSHLHIDIVARAQVRSPSRQPTRA